jgi:hypothetical protein
VLFGHRPIQEAEPRCGGVPPGSQVLGLRREQLLREDARERLPDAELRELAAEREDLEMRWLELAEEV